MNRFQHSSLASASLLHKSIPEIYCSCDISIIPTTNDTNDSSSSTTPSSNITVSTNKNNKLPLSTTVYETTAYYRDTKSKRAKIVIPVLLTFENEFDRKALLRSGAIQPLPPSLPPLTQTASRSSSRGDSNADYDDLSNYDNKSNLNIGIPATATRSISDGSELWSSELDTLGETRGESKLSNSSEKMELKFEVSAKDSGESGNGGTIVEGVTILSTTRIDTIDRIKEEEGGNNDEYEDDLEDQVGIRFDVEVSVRSSSHHNQNHTEKDENKTRLQIRSMLVCTSYKPSDDDRDYFDSKRSFHSIHDLDTQDSNDPSSLHPNSSSLDHIFLAKQALDMGVNCISPYQDEESNYNHLPTSSYFARSLSYVLPPSPNDGLFMNVTLVPALKIDVKEVSGVSSSDTGVTLVSLIISHSNCHNEDVKITSIALHPGHSRLYDIFSGLVGISDNGTVMTTTDTTINNMNSSSYHGMTMPGGENSVMNMTKYVRWGYAQGTHPKMPLVLKPQEAFATVIQINASERNMNSRMFVSPIAVRGLVGSGGGCYGNEKNGNGSGSDSGSGSETVTKNYNTRPTGYGDDVTETYRDENGINTSVIMGTADAKWTTTRIATGKTDDAYRVNLSVRDTHCCVGAQVVVSLKVMNLSDEPRKLTLVMAKENDGANQINHYYNSSNEQKQQQQQQEQQEEMNFQGGEVKESLSTSSNSSLTYSPTMGVNNAVVCEVNGYTFGVWGLSGNDDGTVRYSRDHELLAVDAALLLGEVKGQHSIDAELRFVPLREGSLKVPNLRLYDNYSQRWYDCIHTLKITTVSSQ